MTDWFAGDVAERYDKSTAGMPVEPVVDFLAPLANVGALELAIGTGRIAVPLGMFSVAPTIAITRAGSSSSTATNSRCST